MHIFEQIRKHFKRVFEVGFDDQLVLEKVVKQCKLFFGEQLLGVFTWGIHTLYHFDRGALGFLRDLGIKLILLLDFFSCCRTNASRNFDLLLLWIKLTVLSASIFL